MAAFEAARAELDALGVAVIAASTDDAEHAAGTVARLSLGFPVGHSLPMRDTATALGAYCEDRRAILHATCFLLRPTGEIGVVCYSSGAIGRLDPEGVQRLVEFWTQQVT